MMQRLPRAVRLLGLGWYLAFCIVGGIVLGVLADGWLNTDPLLTMAGLIIGLATAFLGGYKLLMQAIAVTTETTGTDEQA